MLFKEKSVFFGERMYVYSKTFNDHAVKKVEN